MVTYAVCGPPVVRAVTAAAATAAGAQVPPAADGVDFQYHRLMRATICLSHREKVLPLDSFRS